MKKGLFRTSRAQPTLGFALLVAATCAAPSDAAGLVPQHAEDLRPVLVRASKGDSATLEFTAFGRNFRLHLARNQGLAPLVVGTSLELYKGTLEGVPKSWARISVLDGHPRGMIWDGAELFVVDALPEAINHGAAGTVMYKLSEAVLEQGASFANDAVEPPRNPAAAYDAMVGELRARAQALQSGTATEQVELSILGDAAYLARYPDEARARDAILTRMNNVDGIYSSQLGVELRVASVEIAGELTASLSATTVPDTLLGELGRIRQQSPALLETGLTHLFTGRQLDGNSAGIAYTLSLCSQRFAASLAMAHDNAVLDSLITAHEIGHVFGAPHDGTERCASTPQDRFIMTPTFTGTSITSFSQCSLDEIKAVIESYSCVVALPSTTPTPPAPQPPQPPATENDGGGGGATDPSLLMFLLGLGVARKLDVKPRRQTSGSGKR